MTHQFSTVKLGDVIVLPNGAALAVRARAELSVPVGPMVGFLLVGEMEALIAIPARPGAIDVYTRIDFLPPEAAYAVTAAEGATAYWAPHLPGWSGAAGELLYRILVTPDSIHPIVIVYRGDEPVIFYREGTLRGSDLVIEEMRRDVDTNVAVQRHAAEMVGVPTRQPTVVPQRERVPTKR